MVPIPHLDHETVCTPRSAELILILIVRLCVRLMVTCSWQLASASGIWLVDMGGGGLRLREGMLILCVEDLARRLQNSP